MRTSTTHITKSDLLDYVTKSEFKEFKDEMYEFRDDMGLFRTNTEARFNSIDKRLITIDEKIDDLADQMRRSMGILAEQFREDLRTSLEFLRR